MLAGKVDPAYLDDKLSSTESNAQKKGYVTSPALTAATGGLPLAVSAAVAVAKFTPTTQAYVDSSTITATHGDQRDRVVGQQCVDRYGQLHEHRQRGRERGRRGRDQ